MNFNQAPRKLLSLIRLSSPALLGFALLFASNVSGQDPKAETLPAFADGKVPQTFDELWQGIDPRAEPLEVEVLKEWEEEDVVLQVLRYRVGVFKGVTARMAGVYARPKNATKVPGLVQIHGGGQYADSKTAFANAKRGYACIAIAWAGRISAPGYNVGPPQVQLFWDGATNDPAYRVTTDWGAVDGYHAPARNKGNQFPVLQGAEDWTVDPVASPRNNGWFLCTLAARRALTFLERQPQVDADKLGVYGHSMGGKLTVMTTGSDARVKAAAPSCGGMSDRRNKDPLFRKTIGDDPYLKRITCPIFFLSPANDFHGTIDDLQTAVTEIRSREWRINCAPHHNHQDTAPFEVATQLWFDHYLQPRVPLPSKPPVGFDSSKRGAPLPLKPEGSFDIDPSGVARFIVIPDKSKFLESVDVFYTRHGQMDGQKREMENTKNRHWHHAPTQVVRDSLLWQAELPLYGIDEPLWAYANVRYRLPEPISATGYYHGSYTATNFVISSLMTMKTAEQLAKAGAKSTVTRPAELPLVIESFEDDWKQEWFSYRPQNWPISTHKIYDALYAAPPSGPDDSVELQLTVKCAESNTLVVALDGFAAPIALAGGDEWQTVRLTPDAFGNAAGEPLASWQNCKELRLGHLERLRGERGKPAKVVGGPWAGAAPEFQAMSWVQDDARDAQP